MTTSWAYFTHGQFAEALAHHACGAVLAALALVCAPLAMFAAARGTWPLGMPGEAAAVAALVVAAAMLLGEWIVRLWIGA